MDGERTGERQVELTFQLGTLCEGGKVPGPRGKHGSKSTPGVEPGWDHAHAGPGVYDEEGGDDGTMKREGSTELNCDMLLFTNWTDEVNKKTDRMNEKSNETYNTKLKW